MIAYSRDPNNYMLISYILKKGKVYSLFQQCTKSLINGESDDQVKPELTTFYNFTKEGVDVIDRMKTKYCVTMLSNKMVLYSILFFVEHLES